MSGIEAIVGSAASGAGLLSLSVQLVECAIKLKWIYHAAHDAPRTLSRLVFDLETMALALRQLEQRRQQESPSETLLARCVISCQQSTADIRRLVDRLENSMLKAGGKVYFAFKQRSVMEMLDSLEKAKSSLELAFMMYQAEEQRRWDRAHADTLALQSLMIGEMQAQLVAGNARLSDQLQLVAQTPALPQHRGNLNSPRCLTPFESEMPTSFADTGRPSDHLDCTNQHRSHLRRHTNRRKSDTRFRLTFRLPTWVSHRVYNVAFIQLQSGWDVNLRTYNITPNDSLIFRHVIAGNLEGIRELFESGRATPLDVWQDFSSHMTTLLETAAYSGQVDVCRYLLSQTTWPDHGTLLSTALASFGRFNYYYSLGCEVEMYRLFVADAEFNADLDEGLRSGWLQYCSRIESLEAILQRQSLGLDSLSLQARFEVASRLEVADPVIFLRCVGLPPSDPRLASLATSKGVTVLHLVAKYLISPVRPLSAIRLQQWLDLVVSVLKNGANPHSTAERKEDPEDSYGELLQANNVPSPQRDFRSLEIQYTTPLLECLGTSTWNWSVRFSLEELLKCLCLWIETVQRAGLDLSDYGAKEDEIWRYGGIRNYRKLAGRERDNRLMIYGLVYGATLTDWSFKICRLQDTTVYKLRPPPGAFCEQTLVPTTIIWMPTQSERDEGPWEVVVSEGRIVEVGDARNLSSYTREPFHELVDGCQDDSGVMMLMQYRALRRPGSASRRSHSQPPNLSRREGAYNKRQTHRRFCPPYHLCPWDLTWRFGCVEEEDEGSHMSTDGVWVDMFHVRSCAKGDHRGRSSFQQSEEWQWNSFLSEFAWCQDAAVPTGKITQHEYNCPSPESCKKVRLDRLHVPEELRPYHPYRERLADEVDLQ